MKILALLAFLFCALSAFAADGKAISYPSGNETVSGMLYTPAGKGPFPALIVIHEWWGLDDWVKGRASKFADEGYVALAVDLYRRKSTADPGEARELMRGLPEDRAKRDLAAAFDFLKKQKNVNPGKIGAIGWCMGGGYSLDVALQESTLAADVINYGDLATDLDNLKKISAPILGIFGGKDRSIPVDDVKKFEQTMKQLGKKIDIVIYPDAGHAFQNPNNKAGYRPDDAADSWTKTADFLAATLKKK